jgi:hypothetical protein
MRRLIARLVVLGALAASVDAWARPVVNIDPNHHPNLAAAQQASAQAWDRLIAAQAANQWDLGGHAQRAKELLEQANNEIKLAAETANAHGR